MFFLNILIIPLYFRKSRLLQFSLGPGESGKSTFFKQLQILQGNFAAEKSRTVWTQAIRGNLRAQIKLLAKSALEEELDFSDEEKV